MLQHPGDPHIPNLNTPALTQEDILRLQVPMDNFPIVEMFYA